MTSESPVTEKAMPLKVARSGRAPTSSWTNNVTTGWTVRTPNCAISSTKNRARRPGERATEIRPPRIDRPPRVCDGATKRSRTVIQTMPVDIRIVAEVQ